MQNVAHHYHVGFRQRVGEEVAGRQLDAPGHLGRRNQLPRQRQYRRQVEDHGAQGRVAAAGGHGQVACRPAQVGQAPEAVVLLHHLLHAYR